MSATIPKPSAVTNPNRGENMVLQLEFIGNFKGIQPQLRITLTYIPEREVITEAEFSRWIKVMRSEKWQTAEQLIGCITVAFYDSLLPHHIEIHAEIEYKSGVKQHVRQIKQQPDYEISKQLQRLTDKN